jgi:Protein of unknown function (Hypoth_ymh)
MGGGILDTAPHQVNEPDDSHVYSGVFIRRETLESYAHALRRYGEELGTELSELGADPEVKQLFQDPAKHPAARERERVERVTAYLDQTATQEGELIVFNLSHGATRLIKAAVIREIERARVSRERLRRRPNVLSGTLEAADAEIARLESKISAGLIGDATPAHLQMPPVTDASLGAKLEPAETVVQGLRRTLEFRLLDEQLSARCLDLFERFVDGGQSDRLDTVLQEAGRILEVRLRALSGASDEVSGLGLAAFAMAGLSPRLRLSSVPAEQEAAHLLFRGVLGLLRNPTHHRLLGELQNERVLQQLGMIDYLLGLLDGAVRAANE